MENEKILDKIRKLINKQNSSEKLGNLEEANAFALKVSELLAKHNLSRFDIKDKVEDSGVIRQNCNEITTPKNEGKWLLALYNTLSKYNYCRLIVVNGLHNTYGALFGTEENIEVVRFMGEQLSNKIRFLGKQTYKQLSGKIPEKKNAFLRAFYSGAVSGIAAKLHEQQDAMVASNPKAGALVLFNSKALDLAVNNEFQRLKQTKHTKLSAQNGRALGFKAGKEMDINKGIGYNKPEKQLR